MAAPTDDLIAWATDATYTTGARIGLTTKTTLALAAAAFGFLPGVGFPTDVINAVLNRNYQWLEFTRSEQGLGLFGDGSDGDVTITGGTTTISRDMYYASLTVEGTGILRTGSYRVFVNGTMMVDVGGVVNNDGNAGDDTVSGGAGGIAFGGGSLGVNGAGGSSVTGAPGGAGSSTANAVGGAGGAGGLSSSFAGGAGGASVNPGIQDGGWRHYPAILGYVIGTTGLTILNGGGGGGAGGADTGTEAGGGGAGGGVVGIYARILVNNGTIRSAGGVGGATELGAGDDPGGGGGGGGGLVLTLTRESSGSGAITAPGGIGGVGGDNSDAGATGSVGTVIQLVG